MVTVEEPLALAQAIAQHSRPDTLVVVDCLTLWLTNLRMPGRPLEAVGWAFCAGQGGARAAGGGHGAKCPAEQAASPRDLRR